MLERADYLRQIGQATTRSPVTARLGPRQCGKTTLARAFAATREATFFDLESVVGSQSARPRENATARLRRCKSERSRCPMREPIRSRRTAAGLSAMT